MKSFSQARIGLAILIALTVLACCSPVQATIIYSASSSPDELAFDAQISATDLINIGQPSFVSSADTVAPVNMPGLAFTIAGTNDGETASYGLDTDPQEVHDAAVAKNSWYLYTDGVSYFDTETTLTYTLNTDPGTGGSATGYDITGVNVFAGWRDENVFQSQKWTLRVATLANPAFTDVQDAVVDYLAQDGACSSKVSLTGSIASGVTAVQFFVEKSAKPNNIGIVFRDIDVVGVASAPEPGTIAMFGIAALLGFMAVRRRRV